MSGFINWGSDGADARRIREQQEIEFLMEQARALEVKKRMGAVGSGPNTNPKVLDIIVENSLVQGATVVVGWVNGIQWRNRDGSVSILPKNRAKISTGTTDSEGRVQIEFSPQWIVTDFSTGQPQLLHAPIISYNGKTLEGNDSITLASNVGTPVLNPITTAIVEVEPLRSLRLIPDNEREEIFDYLEEWTGSTLTPVDRNFIANGQRISRDKYELLARPTANTEILFEALELEEREIKVQATPAVSINIPSRVLQTPLISGLDTFGKYVGARRRSETQASLAEQFAPEAANLLEIERVLGLSIEDPEVKAQLIRKLYQQNLTKQEILDFLAQHSGDIDEGNDQCCPTATVNVTQIGSDGVFTILSEERLRTGQNAKAIISGFTETSKGSTIVVNKAIPIENETQVGKKWQYTSPIGEVLSGESDLSGFERNVSYTIGVTTIEEDTQIAPTLEYIFQDGEFVFKVVASGTIISPIKAIGDDGDDVPEDVDFIGGSIDRDGNFIPDPKGKVPLKISNREIGGRPAWENTLAGVVLFWDGTKWIYQFGPDARQILTGGDGDLPFGQYVDALNRVVGLVQEPDATPPGSGSGGNLKRT